VLSALAHAWKKLFERIGQEEGNNAPDQSNVGGVKPQYWTPLGSLGRSHNPAPAGEEREEGCISRVLFMLSFL